LISNNQIMNYTQNIYEKKILHSINDKFVNRYEISSSNIREAYIYDNDTMFKKYSNNIHTDVHIIGHSSLIVKSDYFAVDKIVATGGGIVTAESNAKISFLNKILSVDNMDLRIRNGSIDSGNSYCDSLLMSCLDFNFVII
jgi:hypothetical protein